MAQETWKPIVGTPYEVSDLGRVRRLGSRALRPRPTRQGYQRVSLGAGNDAFIHRLVATAFHGTPPAGWHVDHINRDRGDNRAANLRWLNPEDNRARRATRFGQQHAASKLTEELVREIRAAGFVRGQDRRLAEKFGVSRETIRDARTGKLWRHVQ